MTMACKEMTRIFADVSTQEFKNIAQVFPAVAEKSILERLDNCARAAKLLVRFSQETELHEVQCRLFDAMELRSFRREFIREFGKDVTTDMLAAVRTRASHDSIPAFRASFPGIALAQPKFA